MSSSNSGRMTHTSMLMLLLGIFSIILVATNIFYLPSLGFLAGPTPSSQSQHQAALREFKGGSVVKKNKKKKSTDNISKGNVPSEKEAKTEDSNQNEAKDETTNEKAEKAFTKHPRIAGLNCDRFGGPSEEIAAEMVYWRDIPKDSAFVSPFKKTNGEKQYLTFEPDEGGFNNIRMSMETATALAHAMGRILVLPPEQAFYLLGKDKNMRNNRFTFHKFFPFEAMAEEHDAVEVISMEEFLKTEAMTGQLLDKGGKPSFPPRNSTTWDGEARSTAKLNWLWLRTVTSASRCDFSKALMVFPEKPGAQAVESMQATYDKMEMKKQRHGMHKKYVNKPRSIDSSPKERLHETLAFRKEICMYDEKLQNAKVMHFMGDNNSGARLLVHFYAFLFFEDWKQDLWTKRYVRDHLRYIDIIQCGAATIVNAVRQKARDHGNPDGHFDSMHVRRGDFQYSQTQIPAEEIVTNIAEKFTENSTVFIATDERDKAYFDPLREHYHLYFLDDFLHLLPKDFNKNYYGMLDQRIASRGRVFFGAYLSTFTGYINRMRGYHSQKEKSLGYLDGKLESYFYVPLENRDEMSVYTSLKGPLWGREFPTAWRDIDHDLHDTHIVGR